MTQKLPITPAVRVIAFAGTRLVLKVEGDALRLPQLDELEAAIDRDVLSSSALPAGGGGLISESLIALPESLELPNDFRLDGLRAAYHGLSEADFRAAGRARQIIEWHKTHRFCSRCGTATECELRRDSMTCPSCGQRHFPRVQPAVITLVQRGSEALLGRSPHSKEGVYSTLAGFVEPGESLEECVHREIAEEVGVRIGNLRYFGSQPHPFPNSLMVGFVADWIEGGIQIDAQEIEDARWFDRDRLPNLPHPMSIAHALIKDFVERTAP